MNRFLKIGIVVRFTAMPFVLPSNTVDFHFRWTLSAGMASTLIVPLSCHNKDFRTHGTALNARPTKAICYSRRSRHLTFQSTGLHLYTWFYFNCSDTVVVDFNALFLFTIYFLNLINDNFIDKLSD